MSDNIFERRSFKNSFYEGVSFVAGRSIVQASEIFSSVDQQISNEEGYNFDFYSPNVTLVLDYKALGRHLADIRAFHPIGVNNFKIQKILREQS